MNRHERRVSARAGKRQAPSEYFHVRHSCGHAAYWSDGTFAMLVASDPCPWCGGETGANPIPQDVNLHSGLASDPRQANLYCFREKLPGDLVPVAADMDAAASDRVRIHHMTGDVCCITSGLEKGGSA